MRVFASAGFLIAALICFANPVFANGIDVSGVTTPPVAQERTQIAQNCAWVYREKLCQTEWGRRKYPNCC